jgi:hypothetical protein
LDTVLGLSLTSTSVGWVLVEGRAADGTILDHDDFEVRPAAGLQAVYTSEQASSAVLDALAAAAGHDQRMHVVGVTWSDEVAAESALLLETLTDAGFDNIVPVRLHDACDMLARAIAPMVGYDKAAVCVLDGESTVVVMVDSCDDDAQTAVKELSGGPGALVHWLTALFDRSSWQPGGIVIVGPDEDLESLSRRLKTTVPVPVIAQSGAELALARGAALASAQSTEFTDDTIAETVDSWRRDPKVSRQNSYAGALTMLAAGAVTFVASLSLAVGPHLVPHRSGSIQPVVHRAAPVAVIQAPPPPAVQKPAPRPALKEEPVQAPVSRPEPVAAAPSRRRTGSAAGTAATGPTAGAGTEPAPAADQAAGASARTGTRPAAATPAAATARAALTERVNPRIPWLFQQRQSVRRDAVRR